MKTTILITGLGVGGAEKFLSKLLPIKNVDVVSITGLNDVGRELEKKGVQVTYLNEGLDVKLFRTIFRLRKHLKKNNISQLMTFLIHADLLGRLVAKLVGIRVICNIRNDYSKISRLYLLDKFSRFFVSKYVVNNVGLKSYMDKIGVKKYVVISNAVSLESLLKSAKQGFKKSVGVSKKVITCVARLEPQKDHKTLIKAMAHLPDAELVLVGEGSLRKELEFLASELNVGVHFLGKRDDVSSILLESDVFVLPSTTEGMSNALLEAMSFGLPCVVSNIPQNTSLIRHEENGLVFEAQNSKDLAKKISQAKKSHGKLAAKTVKENYDIEVIKKKYLEILK